MRLRRIPITARSYATLSPRPVAAAMPAPPPPPSPSPQRSPTQPRSHKSGSTRKTQLHRIYLSLLRSTPLMLFFQHNNVRANEWVAVRRELLFNLQRVDESSALPGITRITVLRPPLFAAALRVAEGWDPKNLGGGHPGVSPKVYGATRDLKDTHPLSPILTGPVAALSFPGVEPKYLKVALEVLFPTKNPKKGMHPLAVTGVGKFVLLAGRVDGHVYGGRRGEARVLDGELIRHLATQPDVAALRGHLMAMLRGAGGADLVTNLGNIGVGLARTVDARRKMLSGELDAEGHRKEGE